MKPYPAQEEPPLCLNFDFIPFWPGYGLTNAHCTHKSIYTRAYCILNFHLSDKATFQLAEELETWLICINKVLKEKYHMCESESESSIAKPKA